MAGDDYGHRSDTRDILDVFIIANLATVANNSGNVIVPLGFQDFIDVETVNHIRDLNFPTDIRELLVNYILVKQVPKL